jgi:hypothetical protein
MTQPTGTTQTPQQQAHHIAQLIRSARQECKADVERTSDPKAQALFETLAEVLGGALKALEDFQRGTERAWQSEQSPPTSIQSPDVSDLAVDINAREPRKLSTELPHD